MKQEIYNWLNSGRDFVSGLALYQKYGKNKSFLRNIQNRPQRYAGKLAYEIAKLAGISMHDFLNNKIPKKIKALPPAPDLVKQTKPQASKKPGKSKPKPIPANTIEIEGTAATKKIDANLPIEVKRVMYEHNELYVKRSLLHKQLRDLPTENTKELVKQRKQLSDAMKPLSDRMDVLYAARLEWEENRTIPDIKALFPDKKEKNTKPPEFMDSADLFKRKKNLESSLSKDRNQLLYQSKTKQEKEAPMPAGPKRDKIEKRIRDKEKELNELNKKLNV